MLHHVPDVEGLFASVLCHLEQGGYVAFADLAVEEIAQLTKERDGRDSSYGFLLLTGRVPVTVTTP
jgi:hypothetical protein